MLPQQNRPPVTTNRDADRPSTLPGDFDRIRALLEQDLKGIDGEIEQIKSKLSALEARRAQVQRDLEHLFAAIRILARFEERPAGTAPVLLVRPKNDFANLTQREAILHILGQNPSQALNKKTLTQALVDGGFPFRSVERSERQNTVYQTCRRMIETNELIMLIQGRDAYYRLADKTRVAGLNTPLVNGAGAKTGNTGSGHPS
jgi:hypothetical protein